MLLCLEYFGLENLRAKPKVYEDARIGVNTTEIEYCYERQSISKVWDRLEVSR
jgi:hypothetical protein